MKRNSYDKIAAVYMSVIKSNPKISANKIGERYAGTKNSMRKQDRNDLVKQLKDAVELKKLVNNSDMDSKTKKRLNKGVYTAAKKATRLGNIKYPKKAGEYRRTIRQTIIDVFGPSVQPNDKFEFYGDM